MQKHRKVHSLSLQAHLRSGHDSQGSQTRLLACKLLGFAHITGSTFRMHQRLSQNTVIKRSSSEICLVQICFKELYETVFQQNEQIFCRKRKLFYCG